MIHIKSQVVWVKNFPVQLEYNITECIFSDSRDENFKNFPGEHAPGPPRARIYSA